MSFDHEKLNEIFSEALARTSPGERERYLAAACGAEPELRRQVDSLLLAHSQVGDFLKQTVVPRDGPPIREGPGSIIGRYKLLQQIGEGGFGIVFMAEQQEPVRRMVALKIIKAGMDTREVVARFEAERQALAVMDHPNIARVLDGGSTSNGRPYFVMDLVKGIPITDFCDQNQLSTKARLKLFAQVCAGVQHAHQKGIIHRDLKPTNVLVAIQDGVPVPKVIDFGVAKAIGHKLTEHTVFTRFEQLIGTPAYMSPEQAEWSGVDIDTRSDIYSLGVLLYELLTGTTPCDKETFARAALDEVRRLIRETEPPMPSTRLQGLGQKLSEVAQRRQIEPSMLTRLVRGDLDWIVMKTLEKDRGRRYDTVNALAQDLGRHLDGEPVLARPPSNAYRASKFIRRHRVAVNAGAVVALALSAGLVFALLGFARARHAAKRAQEQAAVVKAVNDFLTKDLLSQANPFVSGDRNVTVRDVLDRAAAKIEDRFTNEPLVEAKIQNTIGVTYRSLDEPTAAEAHLRRAVEILSQRLGPNHPETLDAREELALDYAYLPGGSQKAQAMLRELAETFQATLGFENVATRNCWNDLAHLCMNSDQWDEAEKRLRELFEKERRIHGAEDEQTRVTMTGLAAIESHRGRYSKAVALNEEVLQVELRKPGWFTPQVLAALADDYFALADYQNAVAVQNRQIELLRPVLQPNNPHLLIAVGFLGYLYGAMGEWKRALALYQEAAPPGSSSLGYTTRGAIAALLAGDTNAYRVFIENILVDPARATNEDASLAVTILSLLKPDLAPDLHTVFKCADSLSAGKPGLLGGNNIAKGMAAYRRGNLAEALRCFDGWRTCSPRRSTDASLAGYFYAMIHFQQGDTIGAKADLQEANARLNAVAYSSELGNNWNLYGHSAIARGEAERMILGQEVSTVVDGASLAAARLRWAPVRRHLNEGDRLALDKKWATAHEEYLAAIREPVFDWHAAEAAYFTGNSILAAKIGMTFLSAGDSMSHEQLCHQAFALLEERPDPVYAWHMLRTCLAGQLNPTGMLIVKANKWAAFLEQDPGGVTPEAVSLIRTMAAYRSGRYQEAVDAARISGRLSVRNAAQIFRAMALVKLGRREEAKRDLQEAENNLAEPLKNLTGDAWWDLTMCQLLLEEAHTLFNAD